MEIMVVRREILFGNDHFEGFRSANEVDYRSRILKNFQWMERAVAENDSTYKQPIAYVIIANLILKQVFVYQRSSRDKQYPEKRLQGRWSWGLGGHIKPLDDRDRGNPIHTSLFRELKEEVGLNRGSPQILGYINSERDEVSRVHFGILYVVETDLMIVEPRSPELETGGFKKLEELEEICSSIKLIVEEWARISLEPLRQYLKRSGGHV